MGQRFILGLEVFDTYSGYSGTIQEMNLSTTASPTQAPAYTGAFFIVVIGGNILQAFTVMGKRIDHATGIPLNGVTLLTKPEHMALTGAGYPK